MKSKKKIIILSVLAIVITSVVVSACVVYFGGTDIGEIKYSKEDLDEFFNMNRISLFDADAALSLAGGKLNPDKIVRENYYEDEIILTPEQLNALFNTRKTLLSKYFIEKISFAIDSDEMTIKLKTIKLEDATGNDFIDNWLAKGVVNVKLNIDEVSGGKVTFDIETMKYRYYSADILPASVLESIVQIENDKSNTELIESELNKYFNSDILPYFGLRNLKAFYLKDGKLHIKAEIAHDISYEG